MHQYCQVVHCFIYGVTQGAVILQITALLVQQSNSGCSGNANYYTITMLSFNAVVQGAMILPIYTLLYMSGLAQSAKMSRE